MKSKQLAKDFEIACIEEGKQILQNNEKKITTYIRSHGSYYSIGITKAIVDPKNDTLVVYFNVGRKEAQFEDYDTMQIIPLAYLEVDDPKMFIDLELAQAKKTREDEAKRVLDNKIQTLKYQIAGDQRRLKELMERGY